jgi:hypothetical protein
VRLYTVHGDPPAPPRTGPDGWPAPKRRAPVILRDAFSLWPVLFGPFWFFAQRLWLEGMAMLAVIVALAVLVPDPASSVLLLAVHLLAGFEGRDRLRARLERQGLTPLGVVAARDPDQALFRLAQQRPDLITSAP